MDTIGLAVMIAVFLLSVDFHTVSWVAILVYLVAAIMVVSARQNRLTPAIPMEHNGAPYVVIMGDYLCVYSTKKVKYFGDGSTIIFEDGSVVDFSLGSAVVDNKDKTTPIYFLNQKLNYQEVGVY
jgi:hypothetical protein